MVVLLLAALYKSITKKFLIC